MTFIEKYARRYARRIPKDGVEVLTTNSDPLLVEAFLELGWSDPHSDAVTTVVKRGLEKATLEAPERAVEATPKGHGHK